MEIEEEVYKVGNTPKNTNRSEFESASHGRKLKVGEAASPTDPEKGRSGKRNTNDAGHPIDQPNGTKNSFSLHGPGHSTEECKVLK